MPSTGAAMVSVPKNSMGTRLDIWGDPGSMPTVMVADPRKPQVYMLQGMSSSLKRERAMVTIRKTTTKVLTPP